jgi:hypothetical protein
MGDMKSYSRPVLRFFTGLTKDFTIQTFVDKEASRPKIIYNRLDEVHISMMLGIKEQTQKADNSYPLAFRKTASGRIIQHQKVSLNLLSQDDRFSFSPSDSILQVTNSRLVADLYHSDPSCFSDFDVPWMRPTLVRDFLMHCHRNVHTFSELWEQG